ncbi:MAG: hypothetical protein DRH32_08105 [Deltaproteobacteria bacterium]|nr:MAG: hypothetical protein DRH32_08105 [Deltaproteobacteria bacterium]
MKNGKNTVEDIYNQETCQKQHILGIIYILLFLFYFRIRSRLFEKKETSRIARGACGKLKSISCFLKLTIQFQAVKRYICFFGQCHIFFAQVFLPDMLPANL